MRRRSHALRLTAGVLAGLAAASICFISPASAKLIDRGTVHDEAHFVVADTCGVAGFTTQVDITFDGRWTLASRGNNRLPYLKESRRVTYVFTNIATGHWVRIEEATRGNDIRVTDNGDGTMTYLTLHTTNTVVYNQYGKAIARDTGNERFRLLVDNGGTPTDPSDDTVVEFLGDVKPPTGRNIEDFCAVTVNAIG
jgi:hypothetical protein